MDEPVWRCFLQDFSQIDNDREARRVKYRPDMIGTTSQIDVLGGFSGSLSRGPSRCDPMTK
jgi:hypothetical protein